MIDYDPYRVLGIDFTASQDEVRAAFRRAVRAEHPDTSLEDGSGVRRVIDAYRLLNDPAARARYDTAHPPGRRVGGSPSQAMTRRMTAKCFDCDGRGAVRISEVCSFCKGHPEITELDAFGASVWRCRHCRGRGQVWIRRTCGGCGGSGLVATD